MKYEWDESKHQENFKKHGVTFEEAQTIWSDPLSQEFNDDSHSEKEDRYLRVGYSIKSRVLLVVYCERDNGDIVRIISARKANPSERSNYEK